MSLGPNQCTSDTVALGASAEELDRWKRAGISKDELARPALNVSVLVDLDSVNALNNRDGLDVSVLDLEDRPRD